MPMPFSSKTLTKAGVGLLLSACFLLLSSPPPLLAEVDLSYSPVTKRFSADLHQEPLQDVLEKLVQTTRWRVLIEPGLHRTVSTRFEDRPLGDALSSLLGNLNYALIPGKEHPFRLLIFRTDASHAIESVEPAQPGLQNGDPIPDELVITIESKDRAAAEALAKELGATIIGELSSLGVYRLKFDTPEAAQAARDRLQNDARVSGVDSNFVLDQPSPHQQNRAFRSPPALPLKPKTAPREDLTLIALIDTAVQGLDQNLNGFLLDPLQVGGPRHTTEDGQILHGTSMAHTILSGLAAAPQDDAGSTVRILPIDVYGSNPQTSTFDIAAGIALAMQNGASVLNLSMGGYTESPFLNQLVDQARSSGMLVFASAGNDPVTAPVYPAAYPSAIAVTAGDHEGNIASYANRGDFIDIMAPGASLVRHRGQSYLVTGTSAATAYVSGAAAHFRSQGSEPNHVEELIRSSLPAPVSVQPAPVIP